MKTRPILFSAPMVRALLAGTKTQTRRIVKLNAPIPDGAKVECRRDFWTWSMPRESILEVRAFDCPYGQPGDRLWVRERMRRIGAVLNHFDRPTALDIKYEADGQIDIAVPFPKHLKGVPKHGQCLAYGGYREVSRITLEITGVRVERLQAISESDAIREGVAALVWNDKDTNPDWTDYEDSSNCWSAARDSFASLWRSLHGVKSWDEDPWVWAIQFKRVES